MRVEQAGHTGSDVFSCKIAVPPPPQHARFSTTAPAQSASRVPSTDDDALAALEYTDRQRLVKERSEAADLDRSHYKARC